MALLFAGYAYLTDIEIRWYSSERNDYRLVGTVANRNSVAAAGCVSVLCTCVALCGALGLRLHLRERQPWLLSFKSCVLLAQVRTAFC